MIRKLFLLSVFSGCCLAISSEVFAAGHGITYNDSRFASAVDAVMAYLEGSFGAMIMAAAGIATVICAAFGQYRLALSLLVVAVGAFALRSLVSTFFNDASLDGGNNAPMAVVRMESDGAPPPEVPEAQVFEQGDGVEIYTEAGTKVRVFEDGTVASVDPIGERGTTVVVRHLGVRSSVYGHLGKTTVQKGQSLKSGDVLGTVGTTGLPKEEKPRLYFELKAGKKGQPIKELYPTVVIGEGGEVQDPQFLTQKLLGENAPVGTAVQPSVQMERF